MAKQKETNFCRNCGAQSSGSKKFCTRCGTPVKLAASPESAVKCPSCGFENPDDSKYCMMCSAGVAQMIKVIEDDDLTLIRINSDKIDFENHKELVPVFKGLLQNKIVLDMGKVVWIDSTGIGTLVTLSYKTGQNGQELKLINVSPKVLESIRMLQVDNVLDIVSSMNEARAIWGLPLV